MALDGQILMTRYRSDVGIIAIPVRAPRMERARVAARALVPDARPSFGRHLVQPRRDLSLTITAASVGMILAEPYLKRRVVL